MAKHDTDPVLAQLVRSVNESGQAIVPVTVSLHGTVLTGALIPQERYFADLVGAGIACAVVVSLIGWIGPPATIFLAGLVLALVIVTSLLVR